MADEWFPTTLGECIDVKHGFAFKGEFIHEEPYGDILLTPGNFAIGGGFKGDKLKYYSGPEVPEFILRQGDLLVSMTDLSKDGDTLGYPAFVPKSQGGRRFLHNQRLGKVQVIAPTKIDTGFLHYLLCSAEYRNEILGSATGSTVRHTSPDRIKRFEFLRPRVTEQRAIAHILGTLDERIEANWRIAATLEEMARALFRAWFVTFDPVRAKAEGRWRPGQTLPGLPASLYDVFPADLVETEHGEAPVGWMEAKIGSVLERLKVGKLYDQKSALNTGLVPILDQGKRGSIGFHNDEPNIVADPENRVCTFANHTCVLRLIDYSFSTIQNVIPFRGTAVPTEWIYYASEGKQAFEEYRGHWPSFVEHKIIVPPPKLARIFRDFVDPIVTRIAQNELHACTIATIRDTLLPGLVSGKIRVKDADAFLKVRSL
jgi:type I restriction enzyme S subunit